MAAAEGVAAELTLVGGWDGLERGEWAKRTHALGGQAWERWQLVIEAELGVADATAAERAGRTSTGAAACGRSASSGDAALRPARVFDRRRARRRAEAASSPRRRPRRRRAAGAAAFFYGAAGSAAAARHEIISDVALAASPPPSSTSRAPAAPAAPPTSPCRQRRRRRYLRPVVAAAAAAVGVGRQMSWSEVLGLGGARALVGRGVHLYVFVHGFHGNSFDLRGMRNQLALLHPDKASARYLLSSCNEDHTASASFETLGANLAREVLAFIDQEGIATTLARLSFVGHSFGAVICRAA